MNNETKRSDAIALKTEIGLYTKRIQGVGFFMAVEIITEPIRSYNIKKRASKQLDVINNSQNL
jgi:hypothetical protein